MGEVEQELLYDRLVSGDRPSILALGVTGAAAIKRVRMAVFVVDELGRVHLLGPSAVQILQPPRISDEDLDTLDEDSAINVLTRQRDSEEAIIGYLRRRNERKPSGDSSL
jgi:hypothetical protein